MYFELGELARWKLRYGEKCFAFLTKTGFQYGEKGRNAPIVNM